jgi:mono/diheme cytochrome c family protein
VSPLSKVVRVFEVVALVAAAAFVILLLVNEPDEHTASRGDGAYDPGAAVDGAPIFAAECAQCHGDDGGGGIGPQLSDGAVVDAFPDAADQVAFVTEGGGGMPAFGNRLDPEEINAVVAYTREQL